MKYGFLDAHADLASPLHKLDARAKLAAFFLAVLIVASEPPGRLDPLPAYFGLVFTLALASRVPASYLGLRCAAASPFIWMAALAPLMGAIWSPAADWTWAGAVAGSVLAKAYASILLLTVLTATTPFASLLWSMRWFRAPETINLIATLMYRYIFILLDEWRRLHNARECRSAGRLTLSRTKLYSTQLALVFLRAWERSDRVHGAMAVRGFDGSLPVRAASQATALDVVFVTVTIAAFAAVRLLWP